MSGQSLCLCCWGPLLSEKHEARPCGHVFHTACLQKDLDAFNGRGEPSCADLSQHRCPVCRHVPELDGAEGVQEQLQDVREEPAFAPAALPDRLPERPRAKARGSRARAFQIPVTQGGVRTIQAPMRVSRDPATVSSAEDHEEMEQLEQIRVLASSDAAEALNRLRCLYARVSMASGTLDGLRVKVELDRKGDEDASVLCQCLQTLLTSGVSDSAICDLGTGQFTTEQASIWREWIDVACLRLGRRLPSRADLAVLRPSQPQMGFVEAPSPASPAPSQLQLAAAEPHSPPPNQMQLAVADAHSPPSTQRTGLSPVHKSIRLGYELRDRRANMQEDRVDPTVDAVSDLRECISEERLEELLHPPGLCARFSTEHEAYLTVKDICATALRDTRTPLQVGDDPVFRAELLMPRPFRRAIASVCRREQWPEEAFHQGIMALIGWMEHHGTRLHVRGPSGHSRTTNVPALYGAPPSMRKSSMLSYLQKLLDSEDIPEILREWRACCGDGTLRGHKNNLYNYSRSGLVNSEVSTAYKTSMSDDVAGAHFASRAAWSTWAHIPELFFFWG